MVQSLDPGLSQGLSLNLGLGLGAPKGQCPVEFRRYLSVHQGGPCSDMGVEA